MKSFLISAFAVLVAGSALPALPEQSLGLARRNGGTCSSSSTALVTPQVIPSTPPNGNPFCETGWGTDYKPITNLTVWSTYYYVKAIQATYADGTQSPVIGTTTTYKQQSIGVNYAAGETFSAITLFGPAKSGYLEHLYIKTSSGAILNAGEPVADGLTPHQLTIGAGVMMGLLGAADNIVNSLGFLFLSSPVKSIAVSNLQFTNFPTGSGGINPDQLYSQHYYNGGTSDTPWNFSNSRTRTITRTYQQTTTNTFQIQLNFQLSIEGSIPGVTKITGQVQNNYQWSSSYAYQTTVTTTDTVTINWGISGTLHPGQGVDAVALTGTGQGTFNYVSDVAIGLQNGATYSFKEAGSLRLVDSSVQGVVNITPNNNPYRKKGTEKEIS